MDLRALEEKLRSLYESGTSVAAIVATMGSTDAFGFDNLNCISRIRDELANEFGAPRAHIHADAAIGWAWAMFNDYDFKSNPMEFDSKILPPLTRTAEFTKSFSKADSIGLDFHKTGYAPNTSALFICKDKGDLSLISRDKAVSPYLFQEGTYHPGTFTLETSRPGAYALTALANLNLLGKKGFRSMLAQSVAMSMYLRSLVEKVANIHVVNAQNDGPVTLLRVYPSMVNAEQAYLDESTSSSFRAELRRHNQFNQEVFERLAKKSRLGARVLIASTARYRLTSYGEPIYALKSFVMSPFTDPDAMRAVIGAIVEASKELEACRVREPRGKSSRESATISGAANC